MDQNLLHSNKVHMAAVAVLALLALFLFAETIKSFKEWRYVGGGVPATNTIMVNGEGEAFAQPDIARFTFGVVEEGDSVDAAQTAATERTDAALAFLREQGVADADIQTINYVITPVYEYTPVVCNRYPCPPQRRTQSGYEVSQMVRVTVRDLAAAGKLVGGLGELGVQNVSDLSFEIEDEDAITAEARAEAIAKAEEKAQTLADQLGVRLVRVVSFFEGGSMPMYDRVMGMGGADAAVESANAPELTPGETRVISNVSITYEIR